MSIALGASTNSQKSISEKVDIDYLNHIFLSNLDIFKKLSEKSEDIYTRELFNQISEKGINFPINKHVELFIVKNKDKIEEIIKYLIFRYKFYISGKKKSI